MNKYALRLTLALLTVAVSFFVFQPALAAPSHVIINEIQIGGAAASDEFVELHNPTSSPVNLSGWRLSRRTASGNQTNLLTIFPDVSLPAGGYFLITHPTGYTGVTAADARYSTSESLAANNTVILFSDAGTTIVDLVGMGTASSFETAATPTPPSGQSIERLKDTSGIIDTDNNANDFALVTAPTPMNLASQPPGESTPPPEQPPQSNAPDNNTAPLENTNPPPPSGGATGGMPVVQLGDILVNEFVSDPADEDEEWIELINRSGRTIDLSGWTIEDGGEHETALSGSVNGIAPNNFFVVTKPKGNLNNAGDRIVLKTKNGQIIDEISYGNWADGNLADNAPLASDPASTARTIDGLSSGSAFADFSITLTPTRGLPNIITTAESTVASGPATLRLSELFPNPAGSDAEEWIEVTNIGTVEVSIIGWRISDAGGADHTVEENDFANPVVSPGAYLSLPRKLTGLALNNTGGETVRLFPPKSNTPVHEVSYTGSAPEGASWASTDDEWKWTTAPTSGTANIIALANRAPILSMNVPVNGATNTKLAFSAEDSTDPDGDNLTYQWSFGDGNSATGEIVSHAYTKAGRYRVKLTIDDSRGGKDTGERTVTLESAPAEPQVLGISTTAYAVGTSEIMLNEIFPAPPKGEEEWIELYNQGNETAYMAGWLLKDASGRVFTLTADTTILPHGFFILKKSQTRLALNNTGDTVILLNPIGEIIDETSYPAAKIGASWARDENDEWDWTSAPTPLADNILNTPEESSSASSASALSQIPRGQITISGTVTAAPGMIGERVVYLTGINTTGLPANLRVDLPQGKTDIGVKLNDTITVSGTVRQVQGEPRMSVKDISSLTITGNSKETIRPAPLELADIETDLGRLVIASGTVSKKTSGGFVLELKDGETIRAVLPASSKKFPYPLDTEVTMTGLLSRTSAGPRILLRTMEDLTVNAQPLASETAPANTPTPVLSSYLTITILGSLTLAAVLFYRFWRKRSKLSPITVEGMDEEEMV